VELVERLRYNAQTIDALKDAALTASRDVSETQQADCSVLATDAQMRSVQLLPGPYYPETPSRLIFHNLSNPEDIAQSIHKCAKHHFQIKGLTVMDTTLWHPPSISIGLA
jgi:hypothetical protein